MAYTATAAHGSSGARAAGDVALVPSASSVDAAAYLAGATAAEGADSSLAVAQSQDAMDVDPHQSSSSLQPHPLKASATAEATLTDAASMSTTMSMDETCEGGLQDATEPAKDATARASLNAAPSSLAAAGATEIPVSDNGTPAVVPGDASAMYSMQLETTTVTSMLVDGDSAYGAAKEGEPVKEPLQGLGGAAAAPAEKTAESLSACASSPSSPPPSPPPPLSPCTEE